MRRTIPGLNYAGELAASWHAHLAPRSPNAPTVISTFAGCGGSSLGYSMAGYRELLVVEFDAHAVETFGLNFPDVPVYHGDIAKLSVDEVLERTGLRPRQLSVFDGSPPCQGFSTIGKREFDDARNQLFLEYVRLLAGLEPCAFVMENVSGLVKGKMRLIFRTMFEQLEAAGSIGYHVRAYLLNAKFYGVPQDRERVIVLGIRKDLATAGLEAPPIVTPRPILLQHAIDDLPAEPWRTLGPVNRRIWRNTAYGQAGSDVGLVWDSGAKSTSHFTHVKLNPYRPSPTLTKSGSPNFLHWREPRSLTIAEAKRIASFPDAYQFEGGFDKQWARIGNSVPPFFMRAIAQHLRGALPTKGRRRCF
jgi:DNA (cytosine-5)-methyltransferase 1